MLRLYQLKTACGFGMEGKEVHAEDRTRMPKQPRS